MFPLCYAYEYRKIERHKHVAGSVYLLLLLYYKDME